MALFGKSAKIRKRAEWLTSQSYVVLGIEVPKANEKTPQSAEQFFAALHGIYRNDPVVQEHISFEIVASKDSIIFYVFTPVHLRDFIEGQLYAQYPNLQIKQVNDYCKTIQLEGKHVAGSRIMLTKEDVFPIKTFNDTEVDPLAGITAVLSGLTESENIWIQMIVRPVGDEWQQKGVDHVNRLRTGKKSGLGFISKTGSLIGSILSEVIQPGSSTAAPVPAKEPPKLSSPQEAALKGVETKVTKLGFESLFRLISVAPDANLARAKIQAVLAAFKQYNTTNLNGFKGGEVKVDDYSFWEKYINRAFEEKGNILNIEELASVYHFPSQNVETSAIAWAGSKKGEAPFNLPLRGIVPDDQLTILGKTDFRNQEKEFGIKLEDRKRHIYVIGKSGVGKSTLLENMAIDDVISGRGVIVVDPHGELADKIINFIPESRINDTVVLDPSDREHPIAFNLLESVGDDYKGMVASGFVGIFKKIFGNSWGPRLEYILRNTVLALLDSENATMLGIPRMLTDQQFRNGIIAQIKDTVIRDFWVTEFAAMDVKQRTEAVSPILNKVGQFLSTSTIRNIVGQPKSTIDIRRIMDERKILIVNLSKGKIGEDNMALLGAMIITKVQLAAMSRANTTSNDRPDCFLYVDEFQNFATESFATILSEARKYGLGLTIAHQYIAQMSEEVRDAVIGNVGTIISFRIGSPDAEVLVKEFAPIFEANDLVNLQIGRVYIKLLIDGIAAPAFSAVSFMPKKQDGFGFRDEVIEYSHSHYSRSRLDVESDIEETGGYKKKKEMEEANRQVQDILIKGNQAIGIHPDRGSAMVGAANHNLVPSTVPIAPSLPAVSSPTPPIVESVHKTNIVQVEDKPKELPTLIKDNDNMDDERVEQGRDRPLRAMKGWVYREVSQKGGTRWFLGERESDYRHKLEEKQKEKLLNINPDDQKSTNPEIITQPSPAEQLPKLEGDKNIGGESVKKEEGHDDSKISNDITVLNEGDSIEIS